jgi:hypothetical protein
MKVNAFYLVLLIFLLVILLAGVFEPLRYLKYVLPLMPVILYLNRREFIVHKKVIYYYTTFLLFYTFLIVYLLLQNIASNDISQRFIPNAVFILAPLTFITFMLPYFNVDKTSQYVKGILFVNLLLFLYQEGGDLFQVLSNPEVLKSALFSSNIPTENQLAFVFGFLVIYFMMEKDNQHYLILSTLLFILCFKRVVIGAVIACMAAYFLISFFHIQIEKHRKWWTLLGVLANLAYIQITRLLVSGTFDRVVEQKTGISTDQFLMGRKTFYTAAFHEVGPISWMGIGLGKIDDIIFSSYGQKMNLHSEILKNYFEFGLVLFIFWLILILYKNLFSNKAAILLLYINVLFLTDNVFIYFEIMFYFYFFILIYLNGASGKREPMKI